MSSSVSAMPDAAETPVTVEVKVSVQRGGEANPRKASFKVCLNDTEDDHVNRVVNNIMRFCNNLAKQFQELDTTDCGPKNPHSTDNADVRDSNKEGADDLKIAIENVLNELMPHDVKGCSDQLMTLGLSTKDQWKVAAKTIFGAAIDNEDTDVLRAYVKLCQLLDTNVAIQYSFKKLFFDKCQFEVESGIIKDDFLAHSENKNSHGSVEGRRYANIARFLCEMCKAGLFSVRVLQRQVEAMFNEDDEEYIACACIISKTIGKDLDAFGIMEDCFAAVKKLLKRDNLSLSTRLLVQEVLELRRNNWSSDHGLPNKDEQDAGKKNLPRYSYLVSGCSILYAFLGLVWIILTTPGLVTGHLHGVTLLILAYQLWHSRQIRGLEAIKEVLKPIATWQCIQLMILWMYGNPLWEYYELPITMSNLFQYLIITAPFIFFFPRCIYMIFNFLKAVCSHCLYAFKIFMKLVICFYLLSFLFTIFLSLFIRLDHRY